MNTTMGRLCAAVFFLCGMALPALAAESIQAARSAAAESGHIFCDASGVAPVHKAPCVIRSVYVTAGATSGYLLIFNAVSAPVDGAVTPADCVVVPANTTVALDYGTTAEPFTTGMTAVFSSTGCFTKTASATAFFKARMQ